MSRESVVRSRAMVHLRYGDDGKTLKQVGEAFGVTAQRAHQLIRAELSQGCRFGCTVALGPNRHCPDHGERMKP